MAMRTCTKLSQVALGLGLLVAGCGGAVDETGRLGEAMLADHCPDPTVGCTMTNGTGVYFEEDGSAGIDSLQLLLTRFISKGGAVTFQGRYYNATSNLWLPLTGQVRRADFKSGKSYLVQAVTEKGTVPTWTLFDSATSSTFDVVGPALAYLKLYIELPDSLGKTAGYVLEFGTQVVEHGYAGNIVYQYPMKWHAWEIGNPGYSYCLDANKNPDNVVFQQGVAVNPVTGAVTRNSTTADVVTFSCRLGAIATVYDWGYDYLGATSWEYDSGIQMKRASYCADAYHFTKAGTAIEVADGAGIRKEVEYASQDPSIEAYWSPTGATCLGKMRHPELGFNGYCKGQKLQACPDIVAVENGGGQYLVDAVP